MSAATYRIKRLTRCATCSKWIRSMVGDPLPRECPDCRLRRSRGKVRS